MTPHPLTELSAYLDGALEPGERAAVATHLEDCAGCRARLAQLRSVSALLARLPERAPRRSLVPAAIRAPRWLGLARWASGLSAAAFAVLFVTATVGTPQLMGPAAAPAAVPPPAHTPVPAPLIATAPPEAEDRAAFATRAPDAEATTDAAAEEESEAARTLALLVGPDERGIPPLAWLAAALAAAALALLLPRMVARA